jgi:hypothetical protein
MSIYIKVDEKSLKIEGVYGDDGKTPIEESKEHFGHTVEDLMVKVSQNGKPFTGLEQIVLFAQSPGCVWHRGRLWCF